MSKTEIYILIKTYKRASRRDNMKPKEKRERKLKAWILKYIRNLKKLPKLPKPNKEGKIGSDTWPMSTTGYYYYEFTLVEHSSGDSSKYGIALRVHDGQGTDIAEYADISEKATAGYTFGSLNLVDCFPIGEPLIFRHCVYTSNDTIKVVFSSIRIHVPS